MKNRIICAARSAYYQTERPRLWWHRRTDEAYWGGSPLVSVLIPTHNRAELLIERALPSVLGQTYRNIEVIVAAHGCTDGTAGQVRWYQNAHAIDGRPEYRVRVVDVPRTQTYPPTAENHWLAGPVVPLNAALSAVYGAWIARIDDDDVWEPDHLQRLLRFAQLNDYEFVSSAHETHKGKVEPYDLDGVKVGGTQTWLWRNYLSFIRWNPDCWRKTFNRVNDTDLQDRFRKAGVRMGYLDRVTAKVLPRPGETHVGLKAYTENRAEAERRYAFS